jgi:hypothetical protein
VTNRMILSSGINGPNEGMSRMATAVAKYSATQKNGPHVAAMARNAESKDQRRSTAMVTAEM